MKNIDISFCLPIYNVAPYLARCINSILLVKNVDFEIICVDDCSTDNSLEIALEFEKNNKNIRVIKNQVNRGVSFARNVGLKNANGKYVWFVDPDDVIIPECAKLFFDAMEKENIFWCLGNFENLKANDDKLIRGGEDKYSIIHTDNIKEPFASKNKDGATCVGVDPGMYSREFLNKNNILFNEKLAVAEDIMFNFDVTLYTDRIIKFDCVCYNVRKRPNSSGSEFNEKRNKRMFQQLFDLYHVLHEYINSKKYNIDDKINNLETLKEKAYYTQENIVRVLSMVRDHKFIKEKLKLLKEEKIYPYPKRKQALHSNNPLYLRILLYFLPLKISFWTMHGLYGIKTKKLNRKKNNG